jgi:hypothetical protein
MDARGETTARQTYVFDSPTFLRLPSSPSLKIIALSVDALIKKDSHGVSEMPA